jgi:hypothetical protein
MNRVASGWFCMFGPEELSRPLFVLWTLKLVCCFRIFAVFLCDERREHVSKAIPSFLRAADRRVLELCRKVSAERNLVNRHFLGLDLCFCSGRPSPPSSQPGRTGILSSWHLDSARAQPSPTASTMTNFSGLPVFSTQGSLGRWLASLARELAESAGAAVSCRSFSATL